MPELLSVGDVAKELGVAPPTISMLFYRGLLRDDLAPIVGGRRLIDRELVPLIASKLRADGKLPQRREAAHV